MLKQKTWLHMDVGLQLILFPCTWDFRETKWSVSLDRVRTLFWTKTSKTFQGLSRTHFPFFKDSIQCTKEPWVYVFFSSTTTWAILSWRSFILGTWESGLDKVSTEIQGLSSTDCNFQGLSRPWTFYFKFQGLSRTFKVRANPVLRPVLKCFFITQWPLHFCFLQLYTFRASLHGGGGLQVGEVTCLGGITCLST